MAALKLPRTKRNVFPVNQIPQLGWNGTCSRFLWFCSTIVCDIKIACSLNEQLSDETRALHCKQTYLTTKCIVIALTYIQVF